MASPIGHSLAGYAVARQGVDRREQLGLVLLCIVMANAPDLDVLPGLLVGTPALYHQGISHSLGAGLIVSAAVALLYRWRGQSFALVFACCLSAYSSHLLLDFFCRDGRPPYGIPLLWPLSGQTFLSPVPLLFGFHHTSETSATVGTWLAGIFDIRNLAEIALEIALIAPFTLLKRRTFRAARFPAHTVAE
jgi:inner membrane protein